LYFISGLPLYGVLCYFVLFGVEDFILFFCSLGLMQIINLIGMVIIIFFDDPYYKKKKAE